MLLIPAGLVVGYCGVRHPRFNPMDWKHFHSMLIASNELNAWFRNPADFMPRFLFFQLGQACIMAGAGPFAYSTIPVERIVSSGQCGRLYSSHLNHLVINHLSRSSRLQVMFLHDKYLGPTGVNHLSSGLVA